MRVYLNKLLSFLCRYFCVYKHIFKIMVVELKVYLGI